MLLVIATIPTENYLDISDQEALDAIEEVAETAGIDKNSNREVSGVYERYIVAIEDRLGHDIDLFETTAPPPDSKFCPEYSIALLGAPKCYIVRNPRVLSIADVEEFL